MQLLGHLALGYFSALAVRRFSNEKFNILLVWFISILPDIDLLFSKYMIHRGPTHSIVVQALICLPILLIFRRGLPYFAALLSHSLIGDFLNPPTQLLWPISRNWYGIDDSLKLVGSRLLIIEIALFTLMIMAIFLNRKKMSPRRMFFSEA
jgi:membrane-bound metal-dependent hydrolase YbcI (DUF457 family)